MDEKNQETKKDPKLEFGQKIKHAREGMKISLEEAANDLKMTREDLEAIEEALNSSTSNTFMRMLIIKYLKYLNLDNPEYRDFLDEAYPSNVDELTHTVSLDSSLKEINFNNEIRESKNRAEMRNRIRVVLVMVVLFAFISVLIFVMASRFKSNVVEVGENKTTLINPTVLAPNQVIDNTPKAEIVSTNAGFEITGAQKYEVKITFTGDAYMQITGTGEVLDAKTYTQDEEISFSIEKDTSVIINTGKAENVKITINDEEVDLQDRYGVNAITLKFVVGDNNEQA